MAKYKLRTQKTSLGVIPLCLVAIFCRDAYHKKIATEPIEKQLIMKKAFNTSFYLYNCNQNN